MWYWLGWEARGGRKGCYCIVCTKTNLAKNQALAEKRWHVTLTEASALKLDVLKNFDSLLKIQGWGGGTKLRATSLQHPYTLNEQQQCKLPYDTWSSGSWLAMRCFMAVADFWALSFPIPVLDRFKGNYRLREWRGWLKQYQIWGCQRHSRNSCHPAEESQGSGLWRYFQRQANKAKTKVDWSRKWLSASGKGMFESFCFIST